MRIIRFQRLSVFAILICLSTWAWADPTPSATPAAAAAEKSATTPNPEKVEKIDSAEKSTPLNQNLKPNVKDDMIPSVYKDMVVVQRKAKRKANHWLFAPSFGLDFCGPITSYAINTDIGYALSDFWEVYLNVVPAFVTVERPIVQKVRDLGPLENCPGGATGSCTANITYAKPEYQLGAVALWAPAYGKESWGPYSIVRSDTFFKLAISDIFYAGGSSGMRYSLMVGKTYFVSNWLNVRVAAGLAYVESIVESQKSFDWAPVLETGLVYYF